MAKALMVVGSNPTSPEQEDEYHRWYVEDHFPDVLRVAGFQQARRYALSDVRPVAAIEASSYRYLALYEVEADDLAGLDGAMHRAGLAMHHADGARRLVEAEPEVVARAAMADGVVLRRIAPAEDAGLERLFFELTTGGASPQSPQPDSVDPELTGATA